MKVFILCGGLGSRLDYEGQITPKPLVRIGKMPILWHIIRIFLHQNINEFVLCLGHKHGSFTKFFSNLGNNNKIIKIKRNHKKIVLKISNKKTTIHLVNTGLNTKTGNRIKKAYKILNLKETIMMTYGDGLSDLPVKKLLSFHKKNKKLATVTAVRPPKKFGIFEIKNKVAKSFDNINPDKLSRINGGFFVLSNKAIKKIKGLNEYWEEEPMQRLIKIKELSCYEYDGFWQCMDTLKDKKELNNLWRIKNCPWKIW